MVEKCLRDGEGRGHYQPWDVSLYQWTPCSWVQHWKAPLLLSLGGTHFETAWAHWLLVVRPSRSKRTLCNSGTPLTSFRHSSPWTRPIWLHLWRSWILACRCEQASPHLKRTQILCCRCQAAIKDAKNGGKYSTCEDELIRDVCFSGFTAGAPKSHECPSAEPLKESDFHAEDELAAVANPSETVS